MPAKKPQKLPEISPTEWVPVDDVKPNPLNTRTHTEDQITKIQASLGRVGFAKPLLVDESGYLIAGHATFEAARRAGYTKVLVARTVNWTDDQKRYFMVADNALPLLAGWDSSRLASELNHLRQHSFDLHDFGFSAKELDRYLNGPKKRQRRAEEIDYRDLLLRYMKHVYEVDGTTQVRAIGTSSDITFEEDEIAELMKMDGEMGG